MSGREQATSQTPEAGSKATVFLRSASGVTKGFSSRDSFIYNFVAVTFMTNGAMAFMAAQYAHPNGSLVWAAILTGIGMVFASVVYALLLASMPRSGGDYVFQSRLLSGAVAFTTTFAAYVVINALWIGIAGWFFSNIMLAPFLTVLSVYWDMPSLSSAADWLITPMGLFTCSITVAVWCVALCSVPFKWYARVQRVFFWVGCAAVGGLLIYIAAFSHESFVASFNDVMSSRFGAENAYETVLANANKAGFTFSEGFHLGATLAIVPAMFFYMIYCIWGAGNGGEVRDSGSVKSKLWQILGAVIANTVLAIVIAVLINRVFGTEFMSAATFLYYSAPDSSPIPTVPFFPFYAACLSTNTALTLMAWVGVFAWWWTCLPNACVYGSRAQLAMAMDRTLPAWVGKINGYTNTPLNASLVIGGIGAVFAYLYAFTDNFWKLTLSAGLYMFFISALTGLAAALWPYLKPEAFRASPAGRFWVLGIPLITICGVIWDAIMAVLLWQYFTVPAFGVANATGYAFNIGLLIFSVILFYVFRWYRQSRESINITYSFKEIPPE